MTERRFTAGPFRAFDRKVSTPQLRQEPAALRDFNPAYDRCGMSAGRDPAVAAANVRSTFDSDQIGYVQQSAA
jgi:hypothetical protein